MKRNAATSLALALGMGACTLEPTPTEAGSDPAAEATAVAAGVTYRARNLGALPGQQAGGSATDINDFRHVVGTTAFGNGLARAFLWKNGVMTSLGTSAERGAPPRGSTMPARWWERALAPTGSSEPFGG